MNAIASGATADEVLTNNFTSFSRTILFSQKYTERMSGKIFTHAASFALTIASAIFSAAARSGNAVSRTMGWGAGFKVQGCRLSAMNAHPQKPDALRVDISC